MWCVYLVFAGVFSDLNPVEFVWSKVKVVLRKFKVRVAEGLRKVLRLY